MSDQSLALTESKDPTVSSNQALEFWNNIDNMEFVSDSFLRILAEPQDFHESFVVKNSRVKKLESEALKVFLARIKGKSPLEIERLYGVPFLKVGNNCGFNGVTSSQCLWLYYFGKYCHYPVGLIFDLGGGNCQSAQILSNDDQHNLLMARIRLLAQAKGKTKEEIYKLDPYPNSISKSIRDVSRTTLRYYSYASSYFDLIFKDDICVETDSCTLTTSARFVPVIPED